MDLKDYSMPKISEAVTPKWILKKSGSYKRTKTIKHVNVNGLPVFYKATDCSTHPDRKKIKCQTKGCDGNTSYQGGEKQGYTWLLFCNKCTKTERALEQGNSSLLEYQDKLAQEAGYIDQGDRDRKGHKYLKHRKDYCENIDGRLGFICPLGDKPIINPINNPEIFEDKDNKRGYYHGMVVAKSWNGLLEVDHKNGDPSDNSPENLQTLCVCCHKVKTAQEGDNHSDGRKTLGIT